MGAVLVFGTMIVAIFHQEIATPSARNDSGSRKIVRMRRRPVPYAENHCAFNSQIVHPI